MFKWLPFALRAGAKIVSFLDKESKTDDGVNFGEGLNFAFSNLLPMVNRQIDAGKLSTYEQILDYHKAVDETTGTDSGAIGVIPGVNQVDEEYIIGKMLQASFKYCLIRAGITGEIPEF